jgi:hypothetical protein
MNHILSLAELFPIEQEPVWSQTEPQRFSSFREYVAFEDTLPSFIDSTSKRGWLTRPEIEAQLRPRLPKGWQFQGNLTDITLYPIADPLEELRNRESELLNINGRGIRSTTHLSDHHDDESDKEAFESRVLGFVFSARASSSGHGEIGTLTSNLFYGPPRTAYASNVHDVVRLTKAKTSSPYGLRRFITKPSIQAEINKREFGEILEDSVERAKKIGAYNLTRLFRG